mmetsp:Transcript_9066/g.19817  ORF Transcript_9066/g.19817 Transcript_9066/m.19817 type:complete len:117 (+) Transcript_9066:33-383(+)|eukprot:CAMPEP_0204332516 /NCGR_PEP_ID=MMETSP0469-20131031/16527_1 /ASSEMBLY_ACC=CAM_ASM_000384 /TAXON_ID=2969 /ORGANISM="Oxyrrhis marina" /LENGTH=116 /DNA_ID=CAMNT_0051315681 /DNA_START=33 /DNA_END=383 /DNA_ORIENTATION=-
MSQSDSGTPLQKTSPSFFWLDEANAEALKEVQRKVKQARRGKKDVGHGLEVARTDDFGKLDANTWMHEELTTRRIRKPLPTDAHMRLPGTIGSHLNTENRGKARLVTKRKHVMKKA